MDKLNFIIDLEYAIKPIWFFVIPMLIYIFALRNKFKKIFANFFIPSNDLETEENNTSINTVNNLFILIEIAFLVIYVFAIWDLMLVDKNIKDFGQWGDFFGGIVNPILTFITFIALLITILLQQIELKESREEFKKSANALTKQEEHMELQTFENTFFKMLELHNNIVGNLSYKGFYLADEIHGRKVFESILSEIFSEEIIDYSKVASNYKDIDLNKSNTLGQYYRNMYQIFNFIKSKENKIGYDVVKRYAIILRAQLSSFELILLFINCLVYDEKGEFKKLLIHYSILKNVPFLTVEKEKRSLDILTLNDFLLIIPMDVFCQYFKDDKSAFDGNEVVEKIKPYLECNK